MEKLGNDSMEPFLQMFLNDQKKRDGRYHRTDTVTDRFCEKSTPGTEKPGEDHGTEHKQAFTKYR